VVRGGSWNNNPDNLRAAQRNRNRDANNNVGLRLASPPVEPSYVLGVQKAGVCAVCRQGGSGSVTRTGVHGRMPGFASVRGRKAPQGCVGARLVGQPSAAPALLCCFLAFANEMGQGGPVR